MASPTPDAGGVTIKPSILERNFEAKAHKPTRRVFGGSVFPQKPLKRSQQQHDALRTLEPTVLRI
jgi:hypothetical protein